MSDSSALLASVRRELARLPDALPLLVGDLDAGTARTRPAPDEWSPVEIVCHLRDEETDDFGARLRAVLEGGRFSRIDPVSWVEARRYRETPLHDALEAFRERRRASLDFLAGVDASHLDRALPLGPFGPLSGLDLLAAWVTHDQLHSAQLASTLARLWADRWAPLRSGYAGPLPYVGSGGSPG